MPRGVYHRTPALMPRMWTRERVLAAIGDFVARTGRLPRQREWRHEYGLPVLRTLKPLYGSREGALAAYGQQQQEEGPGDGEARAGGRPRLS